MTGLKGPRLRITIAIANGADMIRVHDSRAGILVAKMADAVVRGWPAHQGPLAACSQRK